MLEKIKKPFEVFWEEQKALRGKKWAGTIHEMLAHCAKCGKKLEGVVYAAEDRGFCSIECFIEGEHGWACECPYCGPNEELMKLAQELTTVTTAHEYALREARERIHKKNLEKIIKEL